MHTANTTTANWLAQWFQQQPPTVPRLWALDVRAPGDAAAPCTLALGGVPNGTAPLVWGTTIAQMAGCVGVSDLYVVSYRLSVCGTNLFGNLTSNYLTSISTIEPCLVLPDEVFDAVCLA